MAKIVTYDGKQYVALADIGDVVKNADEWDVLSDHESSIKEGIPYNGKTLSQMVCLCSLEDSFKANGKTLEYRTGYAPQQEENIKEPEYEPEEVYQEFDDREPLETELEKTEEGDEEDITAVLEEEEDEKEDHQAESKPKKPGKKRGRKRKKPSEPRDVAGINRVKLRYFRYYYPDLIDEIEEAVERGILPYSLLEKVNRRPEDFSALSNLIIDSGGEVDYEFKD